MKKNLLLFDYFLNKFSDFKLFSDDNLVLFEIITLQDLHGVYQNWHFFGIHTTFQLTNNILNNFVMKYFHFRYVS